MICHEKSTLQIFAKPDITCDPLHELICNGASQLIGTVVEAKLESICYNMLNILPCRHASMPSTITGYLLQQIIQTAIDDVKIKVPKVKGIVAATKYTLTTYF
ncbi:MAG: hypothetical protein ACTS73_00355 [Arsenophonus sp. NEOnobi-MAG3]